MLSFPPVSHRPFRLHWPSPNPTEETRWNNLHLRSPLNQLSRSQPPTPFEKALVYMTQASEVCSQYHTHIAACLNAEYSAHLSATFRGLLLVPTCLDPNEPAANKDPCRLPPNLDGICTIPHNFQMKASFIRICALDPLLISCRSR